MVYTRQTERIALEEINGWCGYAEERTGEGK